ncbi:MAG: glycoside hydrolase family 3 N-terminal domain-containing protein [bacterium]
MEELEVRIRIGKLFATRFSAIGSFDIKKFPIANYIVFNTDIKGTIDEARESIFRARALLGKSGIKPVFMIDEEGGRVSNLWSPFQPAPSPLAISRVGEKTLATQIYSYVASLLSKITIEFNLFPCLDVLTEPLNPVIASRSFGETEDLVGLYGRLAIMAMRNSVACIAKHFPGHGMTRLDSHLELPVVRLDRKDLEQIHIRPFLEAIRSGVDGIMIAHCFYECLQSNQIPASLSKEVIRDYLRDQIGFEGLVISDSLDMMAVAKEIEPEAAALLAIEADCDLLLFTEFSDRLERAFETVVAKVIKGKIPSERLDISISRRGNVLRRLSRSKQSISDEPLGDEHRAQYEKMVKQIRSKVILKKDPNRIIPISRDDALLIPLTRDFPQDLFDGVLKDTSYKETRGRIPVIWMLDPLKQIDDLNRLKQSTASAKKSLLVTSYEKLIEIIEPDAAILTFDTTPQTQKEILRLLFKG